jgi:predicted CXXCH cytochrome family protein
MAVALLISLASLIFGDRAMLLPVLTTLLLLTPQDIAPPDALPQSVHANVACDDCHKTEGAKVKCQGCHLENYQKTLDSVHQRSATRGDKMAPGCVDCHGTHDVKKPTATRSAIALTCAKCHEGVATAYAKSVHGAGAASNADVPLCTDCHRAHDVAGPRTTQWELRTPELCGSCHANATLMSKYGLSTKVLSTYLTDFHGKTAALRSSQGKAVTGAVVARCTDCHGVHDIQKSNATTSPVIQANLLKTCQQCHADATTNFPAAWLSHYEPSLHKAPMVYAVKLGYALLIPFMIGGLGLQIVLHLWRLMANR